MTVGFSHHVDLTATPDVVFGVLTDPDLLAARYAASGSEDVRVLERRVEGERVTVVYRRLEAGSLPAPIARLVRGAAQVTQTDRWDAPDADGGRTARWSVVTKGVAVDIGGTVVLAARDGGTRLTESGTVTARMPLVGALIERLAVEQSGQKLRREWEWLSARL
ncbi:DUF2505 domain-containing protein [Jatrophihabitans endophyticus]|uniref:DUF2505 domain-containing protein n=1 Tax=Jatrophihabitans endophyticus TaxID=1206085 RepID=UPI0019F5D8E8|nr:DUF2505 domain-containing protein [Jatrophihabitans endophyticus]MBE7188671.1 DUF2505 domain-containing protein [Jatrophihabitans endophyticus]